MIISIDELLTLLHDASVERLKRPDIVRIKLGERVDLLCQDLHQRLQHFPDGFLIGFATMKFFRPIHTASVWLHGRFP